MSTTVKGAGDLKAFLASLPENLEKNILRGALRAGAVVIADKAKEECRSEEVRDSIGVSTKIEPGGIVVAKVQTKGAGAYIAPWLEHGTDPHFISVDDSQSGGRTVRRVNREVKRGSLIIGGKFVGETVHHPGAKPFPFMRPAVDTGEQAAIEAIGGYITNRLTKGGLATPAAIGPDDE